MSKLYKPISHATFLYTIPLKPNKQPNVLPMNTIRITLNVISAICFWTSLLFKKLYVITCAFHTLITQYLEMGRLKGTSSWRFTALYMKAYAFNCLINVPSRAHGPKNHTYTCSFLSILFSTCFKRLPALKYRFVPTPIRRITNMALLYMHVNNTSGNTDTNHADVMSWLCSCCNNMLRYTSCRSAGIYAEKTARFTLSECDKARRGWDTGRIRGRMRQSTK